MALTAKSQENRCFYDVYTQKNMASPVREDWPYFEGVDILPITQVRGSWYQRTLRSEECLAGSPPMVDAPTILLLHLLL